MILRLDFGDTDILRNQLEVIDTVVFPWAREIQNHCFQLLDHPESPIDFPTSGSTGEPKKLTFRHDQLLHSAERTVQAFDLRGRQKCLLVLPTRYVGGRMMLYRALVAGWILYCIEPKIQWDLQGGHYDFCSMTPSQYAKYLDHPSRPRIKKILLGGSAVSSDLRERIPRDQRVFESYGMTETLSHIALKDLNRSTEYFSLLPGIQISTDAQDCLIIEDPKLGRIQTNDIVEMKDDHHFRVLGRNDDVINSGGVKLFPQEIEKKLQSHIPYHIMVSKTNDPTFGERPTLLIDKHAGDLDFECIFSSALPKIERPIRVYSTTFVFTQTDKVQRSQTEANKIELIWMQKK